MATTSQIIEHFRQKTFVPVASLYSAAALRAVGAWKLFEGWTNEAVPPIPHKLWRLYWNIRNRKPEYVLELGSGFTTAVMAEALRRNGTGHLVTIEGNAEWCEFTGSHIPPQLQPFVTLRHSKIEVMDIDGDACHRFVELPSGPIDFLFLDGPSPADVPGWGTVETRTPVAADPVLLEQHFRPGFRMIVDGRTENCRFLLKHLQRKYRHSRDRHRRITWFDLAV